MNTTYGIASPFIFCLLATAGVAAQEGAEDGVIEKTDKIIAETQTKVDEIAEKIDESDKAKEVSAGILQPIYALAEYLSFPAVHWLAFAIMATGVVTFALQLVLGKLVVLLKAGFSFTEILSDTLGLAISTVGLFWFSVKWSWRGLVLVSDRLKKEHWLLISGSPVFASLGFFALVLKASTGQAGRRDWATAPLASNP